MYPLDTLKTRIQSPDYARFYVNSATAKPNPALFRGLYQGVGSVIIATLPSCMLVSINRISYDSDHLAELHKLFQNEVDCTERRGIDSLQAYTEY